MFKHNLALFYLLVMACISCVAGIDFTGANWIWVPILGGTAPNSDGSINFPGENIVFRKTYAQKREDRPPICADIIITTDNVYTLYVNGQVIGTGSDFRNPQRYRVFLQSLNVFAISAQNLPGVSPAGLLAAIQIRYEFGDADTIVTDGGWRVQHGTPAGFEQINFDDSQWAAAFVVGPYPNTPPWNEPGLTVIIPSDVQDPGPSLQQAQWIWTNEPTTYGSPATDRAFHATIQQTFFQPLSRLNILIAADDQYTLYVNGLLVGSGRSLWAAQHFVVDFPPTITVYIAVFVRNTGGPAGLIASGELIAWDCNRGDNMHFVTDSSWKYATSFTSSFIQNGFSDSGWPNAISEGVLGTLPWGPVSVPGNQVLDSPSPALPGAPTAPPANVRT